jgi:hypothetical protein
VLIIEQPKTLKIRDKHSRLCLHAQTCPVTACPVAFVLFRDYIATAVCVWNLYPIIDKSPHRYTSAGSNSVMPLARRLWRKGHKAMPGNIYRDAESHDIPIVTELKGYYPRPWDAYVKARMLEAEREIEVYRRRLHSFSVAGDEKRTSK